MLASIMQFLGSRVSWFRLVYLIYNQRYLRYLDTSSSIIGS